MVYVENPLKFHGSKNFDKNPSQRFVSAEIEVAAINRGRVNGNVGDAIIRNLNKWSSSSVHDGSLPYEGFEINTAPAQGDTFLEEIKDICDSLKTHEAKVDSSCGLHVHVDARDYSYEKMKNFAYLWAGVENAMFQLTIPSRKDSSYCRPLGDRLIKQFRSGSSFNTNVKDLIYGIYGARTTASAMLTARRPSCRYFAINLHSWIYRGTIENRMHHGTVDGEKIANWTMLNAAIIDCAAQMGSTETKIVKAELDKGVDYQLAFLISIAPHLKDWILARYRFFKGIKHGQNIEPNEE